MLFGKLLVLWLISEPQHKKKPSFVTTNWYVSFMNPHLILICNQLHIWLFLWTPSQSDLIRYCTPTHTEFSLMNRHGVEHRLKRLVVWLKVIEFLCTLRAVLINVSTQSEPSLITLCMGQRHEGRMQTRTVWKFHPARARGKKPGFDRMCYNISFDFPSTHTHTQTLYFCHTNRTPPPSPTTTAALSNIKLACRTERLNQLKKGCLKKK